MELSSLQFTQEAVDLPIINPITHEVSDMVIQVYGADSKGYKESAREVYQEALTKVPGGDLEKLDEKQREDFLLKLKTCHIKDWSGVTLEGKPFKYSKENAVKLLEDWSWIGEQVGDFVDNRANFMKG